MDEASSRGSSGHRLILALLIVLAGCTACNREAKLAQHEKKIVSLQQTTRAVAEAWLTRQVSSRYATAAFGQTFTLLQQERQALAARPRDLADPRADRLARDAETLSRLIAELTQAVDAGDPGRIRSALARAGEAVQPRPAAASAGQM